MTKAQRHRIYKKTLESFPEQEGGFLCLAVASIGERISKIPYDELTNTKEYFPELYKFKRSPYKDDGGWWPRSEMGNEKRVEALKQCIKETAPSTHKQKERK